MKARWRAGGWWVATLVVANLFLHLPISDFFDGLARRYGFVEYDTVTKAVFLLAGLACAVWLWAAPSPRAAVVRRALVALTALIVVAQVWLVVNGIEAIHYPQYALLGWLLARSGMALERAWLTATVLGALDEIWQWQTLPRVVPGYLDWNDIVLNGIGAAVGALVVARISREADDPVLPLSRACAGLALAATLALLTGPLVERPFYRMTPGGRWFHLLSPFEAAVCLAAAWGVVRDLASAEATSQPSP